MINRSGVQAALDADLAGYPNIGFLTSDITHAEAAVFSLRNSIFKKFIDDVSADADSIAIKKFFDANEHCRAYSLENKQLTTQQLQVINEVKQLLWEGFSPFATNRGHTNPINLVDECGVGPGASVGSASHNFYTKLFDSPLSATNAKLHAWYKVVADHHSLTWHAAEQLRSLRHGDGLVRGNTLGTVPKTVNVSRTTCTEPILNMYFQKGIGKQIERQLLDDHNIDLSNQPDINRAMAQEGSASRKFATIDLSSASDTIALSMLRAVMPIEFFQLLQTVRSPSVFHGGRWVDLHMVGTMGNGFTFPLQTYLFATVVKACYRVMGIKPLTANMRNYSVFGDDIIVLNETYNFVSAMLEVFGFIVNHDKSFASGDFRESCGGDFFHGLNIRGVYIKSLKNRLNINAAYNGLYLWQIRHGVILKETMRYFQLNAGRIRFVPLWEDPSCGYYATGHSGAPYTKCVAVPNRVAPEDFPSLYPYMENRDGWLMSFLGGYVRNGTITLRQSNVPVLRYVTVKPRDMFDPLVSGCDDISLLMKLATALEPWQRFFKWDDIDRIKRVHRDADESWFTMARLVEEEVTSTR